MNYEQIQKQKRNLGLQILRVLLCFWVVLFHCLRYYKNSFLKMILHKKYHVPCFFFLSFYYFFPIIKQINIIKMRNRLERLFVPYLIWPIFIWFFNNALYLLIKTNRFGRILLFQELKIQLIVGRKFFIQLWYLFNLLFLTFFFFILHYFFKNHFFKLISVFGIFCYYFQYSKYKYNFLFSYKDSIRNSVGHFIESFPISVCSFILYSNNIIQFLKFHRIISLISISIILIIIFIYGEPDTYSGIEKNIFASLAFIEFYLIPLDKFNNNLVNSIITIITNYTQGIYCLHTITKYYLLLYFELRSNFYICIIIYIISYIISFFGFKLFKTNKLKYLFV